MPQEYGALRKVYNNFLAIFLVFFVAYFGIGAILVEARANIAVKKVKRRKNEEV